MEGKEMNDYVKNIDALPCMEYLTFDKASYSDCGEDVITGCLLSEGLTVEFTRDEYFKSWQILMSGNFYTMCNDINTYQTYRDLVVDKTNELRNSEVITLENAMDLAYYKGEHEKYRERIARTKEMLKLKYGKNEMIKASKLYEVLYRVPAERVW
jgi:hypothetical protein